jgi:hypothetical protein
MKKLFPALLAMVFLSSAVLAAEISGTITVNQVSGDVGVNASAYYPNGHACNASSQCISSHCVDGYCCNTACSGNCDKCNVAGSRGTCTPVNSECAGTVASCGCSATTGNCVSCNSLTQKCTNYNCVDRGDGSSGGTSGGSTGGDDGDDGGGGGGGGGGGRPVTKDEVDYNYTDDETTPSGVSNDMKHPFFGKLVGPLTPEEEDNVKEETAEGRKHVKMKRTYDYGGFDLLLEEYTQTILILEITALQDLDSIFLMDFIPPDISDNLDEITVTTSQGTHSFLGKDGDELVFGFDLGDLPEGETITIQYSLDKIISPYKLNDYLNAMSKPLLFLSPPLPAKCVDDGVCTDAEEKIGNCKDCMPHCVDDGTCTQQEQELGYCDDCKPKCVDDGICTDEEREIGACGDCFIPSIVLPKEVARVFSWIRASVGTVALLVSLVMVMVLYHYWTRGRKEKPRLWHA